jgi:hypothetical protein
VASPSTDHTASGALLALFGLSSLITALDFTIVYVALPALARDLEFRRTRCSGWSARTRSRSAVSSCSPGA